MKKLKIFVTVFLLLVLSSCSDYLDVVPDNIATIDNAFSMRRTAERYLFTCYSYLPDNGDYNVNIGMLAGDEFWYPYPVVDLNRIVSDTWEIARGNQNSNNPYSNWWSGGRSGNNLWIAIRDCNIFLENIDGVMDMDVYEKDRWKGEVLFLKAFYHFYLFRMYGPIPLIKENAPVYSSPDEVAIYREPVDECVEYMTQLLDEAAALLPDQVIDRERELGRITRPIALASKARLLVTAASPLFNGNSEYSNFIDKRGELLFNTSFEIQKWEKAMEACKIAVEACEELEYELYKFTETTPQYRLVPVIEEQLSMRSAATQRWNSEIIWGNSQSLAFLVQQMSVPKLISGSVLNGVWGPKGTLAAPLKIAEQFYSKNGVPINEDIEWINSSQYDNRYQIRKATDAERYLIKDGYETAQLNFDREPRFYAFLGFDGAFWFGNALYNNTNYDANNMFYIEGKLGQMGGKLGTTSYSITGYFPKKLVHFTGQTDSGGGFQPDRYPWPEFRLADLYLLYSEAINEVYGPTPEAYKWINKVRERAALDPVEVVWPNYSINKSKHTTKDGLRQIIQQERLIELSFEGQRFWDLRRWKRAHVELNTPIYGWNIDESTTEKYYNLNLLFNQSFRMRDYLWPIKHDQMLNNKNLIQNPGW